MTDAFLNCASVSKRFGSITAVDSVDLSLGRGRMLALVGPSGCGKTTLLRLIAGFERPDSGVIELDGRKLSAPNVFTPPDKRRIGMVFQDYALFPHMTVAANIGFGLRERKGRAERVAELLGLVGLEGLGKRLPHQLSGGQQQRVALARALAASPDLLLLDEPFSNLDPGMRNRVRTEVRQIIASLGITAIFVTHDQEEALSLAQEVAVMLDGRIVQHCLPAEVYLRPASRAVAEFLGDTNFLQGELRDGILECDLGRLPVKNETQGVVDVMVRPENLTLSTDGGNTVEVTHCEYYGHDQMVTVRLANGRSLKVRCQASPALAPGTRMGLTVSGDVMVFPALG